MSSGDGGYSLTITEHSSVTAPSLGKLSSSLPVPDTFTFARNFLSLLYMPGQCGTMSANDHRKNFIINHNESDLMSSFNYVLFCISVRDANNTTIQNS